MNGRGGADALVRPPSIPPSLPPRTRASGAPLISRDPVLPVAIDVPRAGTSFSFVRPLVLDEETKVTFSYKSR
jgi:hypothetical protein